MNDPVGHAFAYGIMMVFGALLAALLKKCHFEIRSQWILVVVSMTLWGIGMGTGYLGYLLVENDTAPYLGYVLLIIGGIMGLGSGGLFFHWISDPANQPKKSQEPIESSFGYRLGQRVGKWVRHRHL